MGSPKGLLDFNNKPWILEQISRFKYFEKSKVYIGLGYDNHLYFNTINWFKNAVDNFYMFDGVEVKVIVNQQPEFGSFSTLQAVLKEVKNINDVVVLPIDVPLLNTQELLALVALKNLVVIPKFNNKSGHPVKLSPQFWNKLLKVNSNSIEARLDRQIKKLDTTLITYHDVLDDAVCLNLNSKGFWLLYKKSFTDPDSYWE